MKRLFARAAIATATVIAAVAAVAPFAQAEDLYVGANIGTRTDGHVNVREGGVTTRHDADSHQQRIGVFAGYVLSPEWSLETGYDGFGGSTGYGVPDGRLKLRTKMAYLAARGNWKLSDDWALYGKAGVAQGRLTFDFSGAGDRALETVHKNGAYLSVGAAYLVARNVSLQLEFEHTSTIKYEGLSANMDKFSLGARFGF